MSDDTGDTTQATGATPEVEEQATTPAEGEATTEPTEGGEPQVEETVAEAPVVEPEDDPRFAKQFAAIARRERQLTERTAQLKQGEQLLERIKSFEQVIKQNPLKAMELYGVDLDQIVKAAIHDGQPNPEDERETRFKTIEQKIAAYEEAERRKEEAFKQHQIDQRIQGWKDNIRNVVDSDTTDRFELIKTHEEYDLVWFTTEEYWKQHGKVLPPEKAAALVEDQLLKRDQRALKAKKLTAKQATKEAKQQSQTLTNEMRNSPPGTGQPPISEEERLQRAASLLKWE